MKHILPLMVAVLFVPSLALADGRWDRGSSSRDRGYNYDRGERYVSTRYDRGRDYGHRYYDRSRSRSSVSFSFGFGSYGRYDDYFIGGAYSSGYYRPRVTYRDTYYCNPPVRVYEPVVVYRPPPVVYRPAPRSYYYDCAPRSSFSVSGSYYYRR